MILLTSLVLSLPLIAQPQSPPPLPKIALETLPPAARTAISDAERRASAKPGDAEAVGALGRMLHAWEQWDAAHAAYTRAQALAPRAFEWHYLDALMLERTARRSDAVARFRDALAISPDYKPARVKLADALFDSGQIDESRQLYEQLAKDPATEPMGDFGLGRIAALEKRHEAAIELLERALAHFPQWGTAHYTLALSYRALGRREDAERALARQAQYGPQWPALEDPVAAAVADLRDDARAVLQRGVRLAERGDVAGAIAAHEATLAKDPSIARAHANLISLYGRQRNWAKGEEHYREAVRLGGDIGDAHYDFGVLMAMQQKWDLAAEAYGKAIAANPLHSRALNNLGEAQERQGKVEPALESYRRAVDAQPLFRLARFNAGRLLIALGRPDEAVAQFEKLIEPRDAETPRYLFGLAVGYARLGKKAEALKWATDARQLAEQHGQRELAAAIQKDLEKLK
jgi:tetratricopeptide (TPR) repeat protein